ncbi:puratrophin-1-like [Lytechinus variegatus]|uniref:puratrophin-1-like n=1 Tax=Lytechinus variegatus TaxID=7654 RepID=UPI001BB283A9|nr:puratrophin-1-like [Lytechinus variegatus]
MDGFQGWVGLLVYLCRDVASTLLVISCLGAVILKIADPLLYHLEVLWDLLQQFQESPPSYDERNMPSIEDVLTELYYPFEDIAPYMTAQICDIINRRFKGDGSRFMLDFLLPCRELLLHLKEESWLQLKHKPREPSWPITHSNQILVHLSQLNWDQFHVGDFYIYVRYHGPKKVTLVLVACPEKEGTLTEVPIPAEMFREFFSYHAPQRLLLGELKTKDTEDATGLKTIVVATDTGIMRHLWPDVLKPQFELKRRSSWRKKKRKGEGGVTSGAITATGTDQETKMPTRMASFSRTSSESKKKPPPPFRAPQSTLEVNFEVLHSEAIILTGSRDQGGRAVLEMKANNHVWCNPDVTLDDIVKLLAYVYSIPREEVRWRGLSIAVDARTAPKSDVERVTEALQLLHEHHPGAIDHVYLLIGHNSVLARVTRATNTQLLKTRLDYKMDLVRSVDKLYQHIPKEQLTSTFSGTFKYTHEDWIRFRMRLEPFICGCKSAAKFLLTSVDELSRGSTKAPSEELRDTIDRLKVKHEEVYKDSRMASLHKEGDFILETLKKEEGALRQTEDFRDAITCVTTLFEQVRQTCSRLDEMTERRLAHLQMSLHQQILEEESRKVSEWVKNDGSRKLKQLDEMSPDSLSSVISIQKDFEKFYFNAVKHIGRGEDVLEEIHTLSEQTGGGEGGSNAPLKTPSVSCALKDQLHTFSQSLENKRKEIEEAVWLYTMLDKAYEWSLGGMKFVAMLGIEETSNRERCRVHLCTLEKYLRENPVISDDDFKKMLELARTLDKGKCVQQGEFAQRRCKETHGMIQKRMEQLRNILRNPRFAQRNSYTNGDTQVCIRRTPTDVIKRKSATDSPNTIPEEVIKPVTASNVAQEILRKGPKTTQTKHQRDSMHSNGSVDSGISVNEKATERLAAAAAAGASAGATTGAQQNSTTEDGVVTLRHPRTCKTIEPIRELEPIPAAKNEVKRTTSLGRLDEGFEEREEECERGEETTSGDTPTSQETQNTDGAPKETETREKEDFLSDEDPDQSQWSPLDANRHIRRSICLADNPLKLEAETLAKQHPCYRRLLLIIDEVIQTEQDYVLALKYILENYVVEMDREDIPQALRGKRSIVFGNLEKIYHFHSRVFLRELKGCMTTPLQVGQCFLKHKQDFSMYALYNMNKPKSDRLLAEFGHFFRSKQRRLRDSMDLASYLLKPVQRLGKYALLLRDLIRQCRPEDQEQNHLRAAEVMIEFQMRHGNDLLAMDSLQDCDVNVREQGELLRQAEFLVYRGIRKCVRHVFLFEDLLLFSKPKKTSKGHDVYQYKFSLKMSDIGLTESIGETGTKFEVWFRRRKSTDKAYTLQARSAQIKRVWTADISRLLWHQALRSKETHQHELSSLGFSSRQTFDIKPSQDRIHDRAVNLKAPRSRNSIAISSFSTTSKLFDASTFSSMTNLMTTHTSTSSSFHSSPSRRFSLAGSMSLANYNIPELGESGIDFPPPQRPTAAISPTNTLQGTDSSGDSSAFSGDNVGPVSPTGVTMRHGDPRGRNPFVRSVPSPRSSQIYQETMFTSEVRTMSVSSLHSEAATVETVSSQRRSQRRSNQFVTAV